MARNQEKSQSLLNRWYNFKIGNEQAQDEEKLNKRPPHTQMTRTVKAAEHWRRQVIKEFNDKLSMIQNASLGEHRLRDLNDDLNKLLREKHAWEIRIVELNGPDYRKKSRLYDDDGKPIQFNVNKYMYFGAARELDGVRQMLKSAKQQQKEQQQQQMSLKKIVPPPQYYYYTLDQETEDEEKQVEQKMREQLAQQFETIRQFNTKNKRMDANMTDVSADDNEINQRILDDYSPMVNNDDWKVYLMERKRQILLQKLQV